MTAGNQGKAWPLCPVWGPSLARVWPVCGDVCRTRRTTDPIQQGSSYVLPQRTRTPVAENSLLLVSKGSRWVFPPRLNSRLPLGLRRDPEILFSSEILPPVPRKGCYGDGNRHVQDARSGVPYLVNSFGKLLLSRAKLCEISAPGICSHAPDICCCSKDG